MPPVCAPDALLDLIARWNALAATCESLDYYPGASACLEDLTADFYAFVGRRRGLTVASDCATTMLEALGQDALTWDCGSLALAQLVCSETPTCAPHQFSTGVSVNLASHAFVEIGVVSSLALGQGFFPIVATVDGFSVTAQMVLDDDCYKLVIGFSILPSTCPPSGQWTITFQRFASDATWECSDCAGEPLDEWTDMYIADLTNVGREGTGGTTAWWMLRVGQTSIAPEILDPYGQVVGPGCPLDCSITTTQYRYILTIRDESSCSRLDPLAFTAGETYGLGLQLQSSDDGGATWADADVTPDGDTTLGGTVTPVSTPNTGWTGGYKFVAGVEIDTGALTAAGAVGGVAAAGALTVPEDTIDWCLPSWDTHASDAGLDNDGTTPTWSATVNGTAFGGDLTWGGGDWTFSDTVGGDTLSGTLTIQAKGEYPSTNCSSLKRTLTWMLMGGGFDSGGGGDADFTWTFASDHQIDCGGGDVFDFAMHATCEAACCGTGNVLYAEALQARSFLLAVIGFTDLGGACGAALQTWLNGNVHTLTYGIAPDAGGYCFQIKETVGSYDLGVILTHTGLAWELKLMVQLTGDEVFEWCGVILSPQVTSVECCPDLSNFNPVGPGYAVQVFDDYCQCSGFTSDPSVAMPALVVALERA